MQGNFASSLVKAISTQSNGKHSFTIILASDYDYVGNGNYDYLGCLC